MTNLEYLATEHPETIAEGLASLTYPCQFCAWSNDFCVGNGKQCWEGVLEWLRSDVSDGDVDVTTEMLLDSRMRLEADVHDLCWGDDGQRRMFQERYLEEHGLKVREDITTTNYNGHVLVSTVMHLLDRQAAITNAEWEGKVGKAKRGFDAVHGMVSTAYEEQQARVDDLVRERDNLARDLADCEGEREFWRSACGEMLDAAGAIRRVMAKARPGRICQPYANGDAADETFGEEGWRAERAELFATGGYAQQGTGNSLEDEGRTGSWPSR